MLHVASSNETLSHAHMGGSCKVLFMKHANIVISDDAKFMKYDLCAMFAHQQAGNFSAILLLRYKYGTHCV